MTSRKYLEGKSSKGYEFFGNHKKSDGNYIFRLLAPKGKNVYIIGDFNNWEKEELRKYSTGVFSKTCKNVNENDGYLYLIEDKDGNLSYKLDPFSRKNDLNREVSIVYDKSFDFKYKFKDNKNVNIYQANLKSLLDKNIFKDEDSLKDFISYLKKLNISHISLMPIFSNNNIKSCGYGSVGFFALDIVDINIFKRFIDLCHKDDIGLILEIDIGEFSPYSKSLVNFDSYSMYNYDYEDILYNNHGFINTDPSKNQFKSFILSLISFLIKEYNVDGISISNLENLIYWQADPNRGYNEYWIDFIRQMNAYIRSLGKISIGNYNGECIGLELGFSYMENRTMDKFIKIFQKEPFYRDSFSKLIKAIIRKDLRNYILGFNYYDSLSEGASLFMKMYSNNYKYDQLKTLFLYLYILNSKKMIFMTNEYANPSTWNYEKNNDSVKLNKDNKEFLIFYQKLSGFYQENKEFYKGDFKFLEVEAYSLYAFVRKYKNKVYLVMINFTDLSYNFKAENNLEILIKTFDLKDKVKRGEELRINAFGSFIALIK